VRESPAGASPHHPDLDREETVTDHPVPLPEWQQTRLTVLLDALGRPILHEPERAALTWLAGNEEATVRNIAAVIARSCELGPEPSAADDAPWDERFRAALYAVFPSRTANACYRGDARDALSHHLHEECRASRRSPTDVLRALDPNDHEFCCFGAHVPSSFLARKIIDGIAQ
jgi:hypothetical protein